MQCYFQLANLGIALVNIVSFAVSLKLIAAIF